MDVQPVSWSSPGNPEPGTQARRGAVSQASAELRTQSPRPRAGAPPSLESRPGLRPAPASHSAPAGPSFPQVQGLPGEKPPTSEAASKDRRGSEAPDGRKARVPAPSTRGQHGQASPGPTHEARQGQGHTARGGPNIREAESQPGPEQPDPPLEGPACQGKSWDRSPDPCDRGHGPSSRPATA